MKSARGAFSGVATNQWVCCVGAIGQVPLFFGTQTLSQPVDWTQLLRCTACKSRSYCGKACQQTHWSASPGPPTMHSIINKWHAGLTALRSARACSVLDL